MNTPRALHKQAMKLRIEAGKLDAEAIRNKYRNRLIQTLEDAKWHDIKVDVIELDSGELTGNAFHHYSFHHAQECIGCQILELIKGETND